MPHQENPTGRYFSRGKPSEYLVDGYCLGCTLVVVGLRAVKSGRYRWKNCWFYFPWPLLWGAQVDRIGFYEFWAGGKSTVYFTVEMRLQFL